MLSLTQSINRLCKKFDLYIPTLHTVTCEMSPQSQPPIYSQHIHWRNSPWAVKLSWPWHTSEWKISWEEAVGEKSQRKFPREGCMGQLSEWRNCGGGNCPGECLEWCPGGMAVIVICATLVNIQTHTQKAHTYIHTAFDWLVQTAEPKSIQHWKKNHFNDVHSRHCGVSHWKLSVWSITIMDQLQRKCSESLF